MKTLTMQYLVHTTTTFLCGTFRGEEENSLWQKKFGWNKAKRLCFGRFHSLPSQMSPFDLMYCEHFELIEQFFSKILFYLKIINPLNSMNKLWIIWSHYVWSIWRIIRSWFIKPMIWNNLDREYNVTVQTKNIF